MILHAVAATAGSLAFLASIVFGIRYLISGTKYMNAQALTAIKTLLMVDTHEVDISASGYHIYRSKTDGIVILSFDKDGNHYKSKDEVFGEDVDRAIQRFSILTRKDK